MSQSTMSQFTMSHPSPSTPEPAIKSEFEKYHYIIKKLGSGMNAAVYASIPKGTVHELIAKHADHTPPTQLYIALRDAMQAAKLTFVEDLSEEVRVMQAMQEGRINWFTQELLRCDTLKNFNEEYRKDRSHLKSKRSKLQIHKPTTGPFPTVLAWHWILQMTKIFLYLHLGHNPPSTSRDPKWTPIVHDDIHDGNIVLRPPTSPSALPDIVLCDFGRAQSQPGPEEIEPEVWIHWHEGQVQSFLTQLEFVSERVPRQDKEALDEVLDSHVLFWEDEGGQEGSERRERDWLVNLMQKAERMVAEHDEPLPEELTAWIEGKKEVMDDKWMEGFVERVKNGEEMAGPSTPTPSRTSSTEL